MEILILSNEEQDRNLFISCLSADKSSFTFCPSEAKRSEYSAALRRYQEAKPPFDPSRQAARRIHLTTPSPGRSIKLLVLMSGILTMIGCLVNVSIPESLPLFSKTTGEPIWSLEGLMLT